MASYWDIIIPEATTNLEPNPSFETGTTGWGTGGTNTIAQSSAQSKYGAYSLLCTYQDNTTLGHEAITLPTASTSYTFSGWLYVPSNWDGGNIRLTGSGNFSGASESYPSIYTDGTSATNEWVYLETLITVAADVVGFLVLLTLNAPTAGRTVYLDGVQIEELSYATTYCDGDQPGCVWNGTAHASTSTRDALEGSGGRVRNFADDLDFHIATDPGAGMPTINNLLSSLALQPGALFDGQSISERVFVLSGTITGSSVADFHDKKRTLIRALNAAPATIGEKLQPRTLRYTGADVDKEIRAVYDAGLEGGLPMGWTEADIDLRLVAANPMYHQIGESAAVLDSEDTITYRGAMGRIDGVWDDLGPPNSSGTYTSLYGITPVDKTTIYFTGGFANWDNIAAADGIVKYSVTDAAWSAVGDPATGATITEGRAVAVASDGTVYWCGDFLNIEGVAAADYIAQFDGSNWTAVGTPNTGTASITKPYDMAFDSSGNLYVVGDFTNWADVANADYIAKWDGSSWTAIGSGQTGPIYSIAIDRNDNIYVGGNFANFAGDGDADSIAWWNGSAWAALGGPANDLIWDIAIDEANNLYVAGAFTTINSVSANRAAVWNGQEWSALGTGLNNIGYLVSVNSADEVFFTGAFTTAGTLTVEYQAVWNGSIWTRYDNSFTALVTAAAFLGDDIFFGSGGSGTIPIAGTTSVSYSGTYQAYPTIKIKRSGGTSLTLIKITNITTGAELHFDNYGILDEEELIINTTPDEQGISSSYTGDRLDILRSNSNLGDFYLVPSNTETAKTNTIAAFAKSAGTPTVTITMTWRDTYLSQD